MEFLENSLVVQCLGLGTFTAVGLGSIPGQRTKILQAAQCGQKNPQNKNEILQREIYSLVIQTIQATSQ